MISNDTVKNRILTNPNLYINWDLLIFASSMSKGTKAL